jgi:hypothetical protein
LTKKLKKAGSFYYNTVSTDKRIDDDSFASLAESVESEEALNLRKYYCIVGPNGLNIASSFSFLFFSCSEVSNSSNGTVIKPYLAQTKPQYCSPLNMTKGK